jgi:hypothetical protein
LIAGWLTAGVFTTTRFVQQTSQILCLFSRKFPQQILRSRFHHRFQTLQQTQTIRCNMRPDYAAIICIALLAHQLLRHQSREKSRNIRHRRNHHAPHGRACEACSLCSAQNPQNIVLSGRNPKGFQPKLQCAVQTVCAAHQRKQSFLLRTGEAGDWLVSI